MNILNKIIFVFFTGAGFFVNLSLVNAAGTCPTPTCNYTASSGSSYTVNSGETVCVSVNYAAGTISLNGGTLLIKSGGTVDVARVSFGSGTTAITAATNATPIQITSTTHGLATGQTVYITGVVGNTAANGTFTITKVDANNFTLDGSIGNGAWTSGGTVGYVNTVSNCGNMSGTWNMGTRMRINNYADNAITIDFGTAGGKFYNYGSPSTFTANNLDWNGPHEIYNAGTGVLTLANNAVGKASIISNTSTAANSFTWSDASGVSFYTGDASNISYITNGPGATMRFQGTTASYTNNYVNFYNYGTVTSAGDFVLQSNTTATLTNYPTATITLAAGKELNLNSAILTNGGTITAPLFKLNSGAANLIMNGGAVLNVSTTFNVSVAGSLVFGSGSCAYINATGASLVDNQVMTAASANKIKYCGPVTNVTSGATATIAAAAGGVSNTTPIKITTTAAHGFADQQRININGGVSVVSLQNTNWTITVTSATTFTLNGSTAAGTGGGGTVSATKMGTAEYLGTSCTAPTCSSGGCPGTTCTTTANATTSYTVAANEVLCIPTGVNYNNSSFTITLNGGTIRIASGGTLDLKRVSFGSAAARYIDNCGTLTSSENTTDIDIAAGSAGNGLTITNYSTGTFTTPSLPVNKTFYVRDYNSLINYGTVTMSRNLEESGDNALISNASGLARINVSGNLVIDRGALKIRGIVTANSFENKNNASATITMYEESRLNVTTTFLVSRANMFSYGGASGSCAYIDNNAGTTASTNGTPITNTTTQIYFCGSATSTRTGTGGLGSATASCTTPTCAVALPIELLFFKGKVEGATVELTWRSASETNNDYYTIERSSDGINYEIIGIVKGAGNSSTPLNYSFIDLNPIEGTGYYRLMQTDFDGRYERFDPIVLTFSNPDGFVIYPNPSDGNQLYLRFFNGEISDISVIVYDILGKAVSKSLIRNDIEKPISLLIPDQTLSKGVYLIKVHFNNSVRTDKLVVQ